MGHLLGGYGCSKSGMQGAYQLVGSVCTLSLLLLLLPLLVWHVERVPCIWWGPSRRLGSGPRLGLLWAAPNHTGRCGARAACCRRWGVQVGGLHRCGPSWSLSQLGAGIRSCWVKAVGC